MHELELLNPLPEENGNANMVFSIDLALKMIPEFKGDRDTLHKFIACCDIVHPMATTRAETQTLLNVIKTKLSGAAYNLIKYKEFATWDELKIFLQEQYLERRTIAQIQSELLNCRQRQNEGVRPFANRIERLMLDLTDACIASEGDGARDVIQNLNKKSALKAFVEGLQSPIKLIVKASRFENLTDAVEFACEEERTLNSKHKNFNSDTNFTFKKPIKCFKCGKGNHLSDQCFSQNNVRNFPSYPNRIKPENVLRIQETCRYCKNVGHTIEVCRKRQFNNSRQNQINHNFPSSKPNTSYNNRYNQNRLNASAPQNRYSNSGPNRPPNSNNNALGYRQNANPSGNDSGPSTSGSTTRVRDM